MIEITKKGLCLFAIHLLNPRKQCKTAFFISVLLLFIGLSISERAMAQASYATLKGQVVDENQQPLEAASVAVINTLTGTTTDKEGRFTLRIPANQPFTYHVRLLGFTEQKATLKLKPDEVRTIQVQLKKSVQQLDQVEIRSGKNTDMQTQTSVYQLQPKTAKELPSPFGDFNKLLATLPGVVSNNELSSTYAVRGGNYDENLVYVNAIEVYRPFLVRSGQQEGLSFVNPDLVSNIAFSSGGWQPKYGDKLSSVLNIQYKEPLKTRGSLTLGLLGGAGHLEGSSRNQRVSYIAGVRQKRSQYLLNTLDTKGEYLPRFTDVQTYINIDLSHRAPKERPDTVAAKTTLGILLSYARNRYFIKPVNRQTSFGTLNQPMRLIIGFDGQELLNYDMTQGGLKLSHRLSDRLTTNMILSAMMTSEREYYDVEGGYRLCDVGITPGSNNFNECITIRGIGSLYNYGRNKLLARIFNLENRSAYQIGKSQRLEWGVRYGREYIEDRLDEYSFSDSADYVQISDVLVSNNTLNSGRFTAYLQHTVQLGKMVNDEQAMHTITYGARVGYWTINREFLFSPSLQYALNPDWENGMLFKFATGIYQQPPFYREMRDSLGRLNHDLKAQRSVHVITGLEFPIKMWDRPFRFISEVYYKSLSNVVAYDVENVRLRYFANNDARAYAAGADFRISGEFIRGEESWFSLGLLTTKEDILSDPKGYIRRPTDQRLTFGAFFQDHLPNNPSLKMYLNLVYGTGLPFGPPKRPEYRSVFKGTPYRRIDIGFSKMVKIRELSTSKRSFLESLWISAEVLNVIGASNTISYSWVKDFENNQYAVPNTLSARFLNIRLISKF